MYPPDPLIKLDLQSPARIAKTRLRARIPTSGSILPSLTVDKVYGVWMVLNNTMVRSRASHNDICTITLMTKSSSPHTHTSLSSPTPPCKWTDLFKQSLCIPICQQLMTAAAQRWHALISHVGFCARSTAGFCIGSREGFIHSYAGYYASCCIR